MVLPPLQFAGDAAHGYVVIHGPVGDHGLDLAHGFVVRLLVGSQLDFQLVEQLVKVWNGKTEPLLHD